MVLLQTFVIPLLKHIHPIRTIAHLVAYIQDQDHNHHQYIQQNKCALKDDNTLVRDKIQVFKWHKKPKICSLFPITIVIDRHKSIFTPPSRIIMWVDICMLQCMVDYFSYVYI